MKYCDLTWPLLAINRLLISNYRNIDVIRQSINVNIHYAQCNGRKYYSTHSSDLAQRTAIVVGALFISHKAGSNSKVNLLALRSDHILYIYRIFWVQVQLRLNYYAPQVSPDWGVSRPFKLPSLAVGNYGMQPATIALSLDLCTRYPLLLSMWS